MRLRYIIGSVEDFNSLGIDTTTCRKSVDQTQAIVHQELLTDTEFNFVLVAIMLMGLLFEFKSDANLQELLDSAEWTAIEEVVEPTEEPIV